MKKSIAGRLVSLAILLRGSKKVFSSAEKARNALDAKRQKTTEYKFIKTEKLKSLVEIKKVAGMKCYVLSADKNNPPQDAAGENKQIIYLHGGAFANDPNNLHFKLIDKIVQQSGADLTFAVYPKTPVHTYKNTFDALLELYNELLSKTNSENIFLIGDSAGGNIVIAFALLLK